MNPRALALLLFMFVAFKAQGQSHVEFHLTFSRFLPPWPALPHARGTYVGAFSLDDSVLSYYAELPGHLGGEWAIEILTPKKGPEGALAIDLGRCQPSHDPHKCFVS